MDRIILLEKMVVSRYYYKLMNMHRNYLITKYNNLKDKYIAYYETHPDMISLLKHRQKCNNNQVCQNWDTVVSDFVKHMWTKANVDESIYGHDQIQTKNIIMSEIEKLWKISAYLNFRTNLDIPLDKFGNKYERINVVQIIISFKHKSPARYRIGDTNVMLVYGNEPTSTSDNITHDNPFNLTVKTVEPITTENRVTTILKNLVTTENRVTTILQKYTPYAASVAIGALVMWYIQQKNEMDGMAGGGANNNEINAYTELINAGINKEELIKFIEEEASHEQKLEIIKEINKNKKNVIIEDKDFKEFKLKDDDTVFGNMLEKMLEGGKRKRSTKRSTKKNKKSNRKRRA